MIDDEFQEIIRSNTGCAVVMAGSGSDKEHIEKVVEGLERYGIPYRVRICSAHKQADTLMEMIREYNNIDGSLAFIAIAGGTDALSGTGSFHLYHPVISCPPDAPNESCLRNPPGSSNAYVARPRNVARFIAQMYAGVNPDFRTALEEEIRGKVASLEEADREFHESYRRE